MFGLAELGRRAQHYCSFILEPKAPRGIERDESVPVLGVGTSQSAEQRTPDEMEDAANTTGWVQHVSSNDIIWCKMGQAKMHLECVHTGGDTGIIYQLLSCPCRQT